jgi:hypothetical protein
MKKIIVMHGMSRRIAQAMSCSATQVSLALNYRDDSLLSRRIRKVAVEQYGGRELEL